MAAPAGCARGMGERGGGTSFAGAFPPAAAAAWGAGGRSVPTSAGGTLEPLGAGSDEAPRLVTWIMKAHLRHFIRTDRPATFSSAIWYFALQLGQRNFIRQSAVGG